MRDNVKDRLNGQYYNCINGVQYPAGFKTWLIQVAKLLQTEFDCFEGVLITGLNVDKCVDPESWMVYFMDGYNPRFAIYEDLTNA